jgi:hypothetical protein
LTCYIYIYIIYIYGCYLIQANPLTLPKRRVIKANNYYLNTIAQRDDSGMQLYTSDENNFELNILGYV